MTAPMLRPCCQLCGVVILSPAYEAYLLVRAAGQTQGAQIVVHRACADELSAPK